MKKQEIRPKGRRFPGESTTTHMQTVGPKSQCPSFTKLLPDLPTVHMVYFLIAIFYESATPTFYMFCSVFTCWSLPMESSFDLYFPFRVWPNQPQRGFVVCAPVRTGAGLQ